MSRLLGLDVGDRRIGVALADPDSGMVRPLTTLTRGAPDRDARAILRLCQEHGVDGLVVGLPLDADDSEGPQAVATRAWLAGIVPLVGLPVRLRDERFTSEDARTRLGRPPRGRSGGPPSPQARRAWRARVDREAAAAILQAELDAQVTPAGQP